MASRSKNRRAGLTKVVRREAITVEAGAWDLIEPALTTIALENNFAATFKEARGKVERKLKLGF